MHTNSIVKASVLAAEVAVATAGAPVTLGSLVQGEVTTPDPYHSLRGMRLPAETATLLVKSSGKTGRFTGEDLMSMVPENTKLVPVGNDGYAVIAPRDALVAMVDSAAKRQNAATQSKGLS